jgi:2-polyprenyl-3-methyl-5-hydroxy-6-metoxy-1,4-benzoquinol methylase
MKIAGGLRENEVIIGNVFNKYDSRNPVVRWIMRGFEDCLSELVAKAAPNSIHEVGCGEGYWVLKWNRAGLSARGSDFSEKAIRLARTNALEHGLSQDLFAVRSMYDLDPEMDSADLVVCCEVLEHLERPEEALRRLRDVARQYVLLSVPREPLWRILNVARGKYLGSMGNTEGHLQHWSQNGFIRLVEQYLHILEVRAPVPWTMLLCRARA